MTNQIDIGAVQTVRKLALAAIGLAAIALSALVDSRWEHPIRHGIETVGLFFIVVSIFGRTWCSLYIHGRKNREIVDRGPYSVCRNPLYVFSIIGAAGVGSLSGSLTIGFAAAVLTSLVFFLVVFKEEHLLTATYGDRYRTYQRRVPRFLPNFSLYANSVIADVNFTGILRTFADACVFLAAVPVMETLEYLRTAGVVPTLLTLP